MKRSMILDHAVLFGLLRQQTQVGYGNLSAIFAGGFPMKNFHGHHQFDTMSSSIQDIEIVQVSYYHALS